MKKKFAYVLVGALAIAGQLIGCDNSEAEIKEVENAAATWSPTSWFGVKAVEANAMQTRADEISNAKSMLWVVGDNVSAPLLYAPEQLQAMSDAFDQPIAHPDVLVPDAIAPGTKLEIHAMRDGEILDTVGEIVVSDGNVETPFGYWRSSNWSQCYSPPGFVSCPCYSCTSITLNAITKVVNSCNGTGSCGAGNDHACWTSWYRYYCGEHP